MATARHRLMKVRPALIFMLSLCAHCMGLMLKQEFKEATKQKPSDTGITLIPNEDNLFAWKALLQVTGG